MVARRVVLDHTHPCLACGAPWRVRLEARITGKPAAAPAVWEERDSGCSKLCWRGDPDAYASSLHEREQRGWPP